MKLMWLKVYLETSWEWNSFLSEIMGSWCFGEEKMILDFHSPFSAQGPDNIH